MRDIKRVAHHSTTKIPDDPEFLQVNIQRKGFDSEWLQMQVDNKSITSRTRDDILNMAILLEEYYSGQWDIQIEKKVTKWRLYCTNTTYGAGNDYEEDIDIPLINFYIIINHPSFTITNSQNKSHQMLDLLVRLSYQATTPEEINFKLASKLTKEQMIDNPNVFTDGYLLNLSDNKFEVGMWGIRTSVSINEYNTGYQHSHLHARGPTNDSLMKWDNLFCMGTGEINQLFAMIVNGYTPELFTMLLIMIGNFVRWESREGTPYYYFRDVKGVKPITKFPTLTQTTIYKYLESLKIKLRADNQRPKLEWGVKNGLVKLLDNEDFEQMLKLSNDYKAYNDKLIFWPVDNGFCDRRSLEANQAPTNITTNTVLFRGEQVGLTIVIPEVRELTDDFIIHPEIKQLVRAKLESYANYKKIREDIVRRANQIADQQRSLQQNNVPV